MTDIETVSVGALSPPAVRRFLSESAVAYPVEVGRPDLTDWPEKLVAHATTFCTRRPDGSLSSALFAYLNPETHIGYIPFFCVLPDPQLSTLNPHRPKGLAFRLHEAYREVAMRLGLKTLRLEVLHSNTHAIEFYKRQGYTVAENRPERRRYLMEHVLLSQPMKAQIPLAVTTVDLEVAPFVNAEQAKDWACRHGIPGLMSDVDTKGKGEIAISLNSLEKMLSGSAVRKSVTPGIHYAALMRLRDIIRESFVAEIHPDYKKINGVRSVANGINPMLQIAVLYGAVSLAGIVYRAKTTLKLYRDPVTPTKAYSYEISNIEVLTGTARVVTLPNVLTSMDVDSLLQGVRRVNGELFVNSPLSPLLPTSHE